MIQSFPFKSPCKASRILGVLLLSMIMGSMARAALAQMAEAKEPPQEQQESPPEQENLIVWLFRAQGIFFFPQLAISILLVALIVTNALAIRRVNFVPHDFIEQFEGLIKEKKFNEALELTGEEPSMVGRLLDAGMRRLPVGYQEALAAVRETGEEENLKYEQRLSYLALLGNIATLVGLLGTVWGMVASFMEIGRSSLAPDPKELARGVSQALVTTVAGLVQAIPAIICFTFFKNRVTMLVLEVGFSSERLLQLLRSVPVRKKGETTTSP